MGGLGPRLWYLPYNSEIYLYSSIRTIFERVWHIARYNTDAKVMLPQEIQLGSPDCFSRL